MIKEIFEKLTHKEEKATISMDAVRKNIAKVVLKYKERLENAENIQEKLLWNRKLEAVAEVVDALQIPKDEVGL